MNSRLDILAGIKSGLDAALQDCTNDRLTDNLHNIFRRVHEAERYITEKKDNTGEHLTTKIIGHYILKTYRMTREPSFNKLLKKYLPDHSKTLSLLFLNLDRLARDILSYDYKKVRKAEADVRKVHPFLVKAENALISLYQLEPDNDKKQKIKEIAKEIRVIIEMIYLGKNPQGGLCKQEDCVKEIDSFWRKINEVEWKNMVSDPSQGPIETLEVFSDEFEDVMENYLPIKFRAVKRKKLDEAGTSKKMEEDAHHLEVDPSKRKSALKKKMGIATGRKVSKLGTGPSLQRREKAIEEKDEEILTMDEMQIKEDIDSEEISGAGSLEEPGGLTEEESPEELEALASQPIPPESVEMPSETDTEKQSFLSKKADFKSKLGSKSTLEGEARAKIFRKVEKVEPAQALSTTETNFKKTKSFEEELMNLVETQAEEDEPQITEGNILNSNKPRSFLSESIKQSKPDEAETEGQSQEEKLEPSPEAPQVSFLAKQLQKMNKGPGKSKIKPPSFKHSKPKLSKNVRTTDDLPPLKVATFASTEMLPPLESFFKEEKEVESEEKTADIEKTDETPEGEVVADISSEQFSTQEASEDKVVAEKDQQKKSDQEKFSLGKFFKNIWGKFTSIFKKKQEDEFDEDNW
ncbi:MAG: hypothetical protein ACLFQV_05105 [Vulcanimicrobiota bacterium]